MHQFLGYIYYTFFLARQNHLKLFSWQINIYYILNKFKNKTFYYNILAFIIFYNI